MTDRDLDVVVYGATGFVGALLADYLVRNAPHDARIGLAGRSRDKLEKVKAGLGRAAAGWEVLVADASDTAALDAMVGRTRVVATTVGPYARYGLPLASACARSGTHYADLTGEVLFHRDSIDANDADARLSGAKIVHSCGFDSIPSDLGVHVLHEAVQAAGAGELTDTTLVVRGTRGGVSGGTIDSLRAQVEVTQADRAQAKVARSPYSLTPDRAAEPDVGPQPDGVVARASGIAPGLDGWIAPFVMAPYNTRVVRRSNALRGHAYGSRFKYAEAVSMGSSPVAPVLGAAMAGGLLGFQQAMAFGPARAVLDRLLPSPGDGPGEKTRNSGFFRLQVHGTTTTDRHFTATVAAQGDPGYKATAVMLGESALCLAFDDLGEAGGVLTPATAMGTPLVDRLRAQGFTLEADED
ncbi:trans-acting enoyl reductase family protein [Rhodococcus aerolatus]